MADRTESGRLSLAGFLYQIVGSGAESCTLTCHEEESDEAGEILELEQLGQDLVCFPTDGSAARLIQFKYSSKNAEIKPSGLRTIVETFLACVEEAEKQINEFNYELVTNRLLHKDIGDWETAQEEGDLEKLSQCIQKSSQTKIENLDQLCEVYLRLKVIQKSNDDLESELRQASAELGVLSNEMESGIDGVIGLLAKKSTPAESPRIIPSKVCDRLAGHDNAIKLLSDKSVDMRSNKIGTFQREEMRTNDFGTPPPIVPRIRAEDVSNAILNYPVVVIHGTGGCGKSILLADVALQFLNDTSSPPGFCMMMRANSFLPNKAAIAVSKWRGAGAKVDADFRFAFCRLETAYQESPVIVFFIDAIDEKPDVTLSDSTRDFITDLIQMATDSRGETGTHQVAVVLACRHLEEARNIRRVGNPIAAEHDVEFISMLDYGNEELLEAVKAYSQVDSDVVARIIKYCEDDESLTLDTHDQHEEVAEEAIEVLSNPVFWYLFTELPKEQQHKCLNGDSSAFCELGNDYVKWFESKASSRMKLRRGVCRAAFHAAAKTFESAGNRGDIELNWVKPIAEKTNLSETDAELLFLEAASAGIVVTEEAKNKVWRWKFPWFCEFLVEKGGIIE